MDPRKWTYLMSIAKYEKRTFQSVYSRVRVDFKSIHLSMLALTF